MLGGEDTSLIYSCCLVPDQYLQLDILSNELLFHTAISSLSPIWQWKTHTSQKFLWVKSNVQPLLLLLSLSVK